MSFYHRDTIVYKLQSVIGFGQPTLFPHGVHFLSEPSSFCFAGQDLYYFKTISVVLENLHCVSLTLFKVIELF